MLSLVSCQVGGDAGVNVDVQDGADGKDGIIPHIGENGNWWIGDNDTGVSAIGAAGLNGVDGEPGKDGQNGKDGIDGENGIDGESAYDIAVSYGFTGNYEEWCQLMSCSSGDLTDALKASNGYEDMVKSILGSSSYLIVTNYGIKPNTGEDLATKIQNLINSSPNKTLFFPDGEYIVSKPIQTSENPSKSVSIKLSNYAVIKASSNWTGGSGDSGDDSTNAVIMLGVPPTTGNPANNISATGCNFYLEGGTIDGNGIANGVTIEKSRESRVANVAIKNTVVGLYVKKGVNSVSSDADILNLSIVGNGASNSIGLKCVGYDNTFDNINISGVKTGVLMDGGGNFLRSIYVHNTLAKSSYSGSAGIKENNGSGNWYLYCTAEQFESGFVVRNSSNSLYDGCTAIWTDGTYGTSEIAFKTGSSFKATIKSPKVVFASNSTVSKNYVLNGATSGSGIIEYPIIDEAMCGNTTYKRYVVKYTVGGN